jgi:RimJ/RimL family protein N-acetyltransferase
MPSNGPEFSEEHTLADGSRVRLRYIRPEDADELRRGFDRLSPASRYRRFLGGVGHLSDENIRYLTNVDGHDHVAIVAARLRPDGTEEGLGVARFIRVAGEPKVAEAAITVVDDEQHKGIGLLLGLALAAAARDRGIDHFRGEVLGNNEAVQQLLREVGAVLRAAEDDRIVFDLALDRESPATAPRDLPLRRLLGAAATWLGGLVRRPFG